MYSGAATISRAQHIVMGSASDRMTTCTIADAGDDCLSDISSSIPSVGCEPLDSHRRAIALVSEKPFRPPSPTIFGRTEAT
jgi:hypothetical protein